LTIPLALSSYSKSVADDINSSSNVTLVEKLNVSPSLLEQYNVRYTEKWVKRIDENFCEYYNCSKPSLNVYPSLHSRSRLFITEKFFSGDVSGMISESLFVYLLHMLGVNIDLVSHLRPLKAKDAFNPDFAVYDVSSSTRLNLLVHSRHVSSPIYAEVKGSTGSMNKDRIEKAITQLNRLVISDSDVGLIFLVFRNAFSFYEGVALEVLA